MTKPEHEPNDPAATPETKGAPIETPRIYVASLSDYNAGHLHGEWVDCTISLDDMSQSINGMLAESDQPIAEEYAIHDYDNFGNWHPHEYESLETIKTVSDAIARHGEAVTHWITYLDDTGTEATETFDDHYLGRWDTMADYVSDATKDVTITTEPPTWQPYVRLDEAAIARDSEVELHVSSDGDGKLHLFTQPHVSEHDQN